MLASQENGAGNFDKFVIFTENFNSEQSSIDEKMWEVLIVDDEQDVHKMTKMVLRNYTFQGQKINFHSAYSAQEAKEVLNRNDNIALVLLDVVMEEKDAGLKLVEYIRQDLENESIRIIIRTGQPGEAPEETVIRDYVINDYIEKGDITTRRLYTTITTSLRGYKDIIALRQSYLELKQLSEKLETAYARLETLDREKAKIIQFLYHELLTPLNHVGASQVFDENNLSEQNRAVLEMVRKGFNRLNSLIKAFLEYFEFMGSDLKLKAKKVSIDKVLNNVLEKFETQIRKAKLIVESDLSEADKIYMDPKYLKDVLSILIDNAINHSEKKGKITIKTLVDKKKPELHLVISDSGVGILPRNLEKVFQAYDLEAYYRREDGFGLNLSKARFIVESHGGRIWAESKGTGEGSSFIVALPIRD